jgi:uncharacterized protein YndB with AHSA1/START domain
MDAELITYNELLNAPASAVWRAITDKDEMKKWYFDLSEFKPVEGFKFEFSGGPSPDRQYLHLCEVTEVEMEKQITYSWAYDGYSGKSFVTFALSPRGDQTMLTLSHAGIETFPSSNPDFAINNFREGWKHLIQTSLKSFLNNS